jgi:hypothetical protein
MPEFPTILIGAAAWCMALLTGVSAIGGQLSGSFTDLTSGTQINLSSGSADWVHWGEENSRTVNRKAGVGPQISGIETIPADTNAYVSYFRKTDSPVACTWMDGTPTLSRTNTTNYVWMYCASPVNTGFRLSALADTRPRTLKLYLGVENGDGKLTASLSDGSAIPYTDESLKSQGNVKFAAGAYSLTYSANSPGQRVNIEWILTSGNQGEVKLQAAALITPGISALPLASITSPTNGQSFSPLSIPVSMATSDVDGTVTNLAVYLDGVFQSSITNGPWNLVITNAPPGIHRLTAVATDNTGEVSTSAPVEIAVYSGNNQLNGQLTKFPAEVAMLPVDLSAEGSLDWVNWGYPTRPDVNRKSGAPLLISSTYPYSGTNELISLDGGSYFTWSWTDGTPTLENPYSATGIQARRDTNGFQLQLASSPQGHLARIYLGDYGSKATVRAYFTNHSAPMFYQDYNLIDIYQTVDAMCEIRYASESPSSVVVKIDASELYDVLFGGTRLMSATVQPDNTVLLPLQLTTPQATEAGPVFSFFTQPDHNYVVEFTPTLPATNWDIVTTLPGIGNWLTITNPPLLGDQGYYRVRIQ